MDCPEIRRGFVAGREPAGPALEVHLKSCPHCRELFEKGALLGLRLAQAVLPEVEPGNLFTQVDRDVRREVGVRAQLRALPTRFRVGGLVGGAAALVLWQLLLRRRPDFTAYPRTIFWGVVALLGATIVAGSLRLMRGVSAPLGSRARERWIAVALLVAPALTLLLVPLGSSSSDAASWGSPGSCFSYGAALVAPFLVLCWLFERRDIVPVTVLVAAGALAGVTANMLLYAHCPSVHLGHLLLGHASIGAAWALALGILSGQLQRTR